jgi:hypothetical protein
MFNKLNKIYTYFYQNTAEIEKRLTDLSVFDFSTLLSADESLVLTNRLKLVSDNFAKKDLNELLWLDKQMFNFIDSDLIWQFLSSPDKDKMSLLADNLKLVNAAIGEEDNLVRYNSAEISACLNLSKKDFDYFSLIFSLRQELLDQYNRDLVKAIFSYLQKISIYKDWEIKELVVLIYLLNIVWKNFDFILPEEQSYLLSLFFYISVFSGIPVTDILKNSVYQTNNPVAFVVKNNFLAQALDKNIEIIPADEKLEQMVDLAEILKFFSTTDQEANIFVKNNYKTSQKVLIDSLTEVLSVYRGLHASNLIEKNYAGEDSEVDSYEQEVSNLLNWFIVKADWNKLLDYYKNKKVRVPFVVFIENLPRFIDLEKTAAAEKISEFTDLLKSNNIIPSDQEIIEFHESDGQFHWATWIK